MRAETHLALQTKAVQEPDGRPAAYVLTSTHMPDTDAPTDGDVIH